MGRNMSGNLGLYKYLWPGSVLCVRTLSLTNLACCLSFSSLSQNNIIANSCHHKKDKTQKVLIIIPRNLGNI